MLSLILSFVWERLQKCSFFNQFRDSRLRTWNTWHVWFASSEISTRLIRFTRVDSPESDSVTESRCCVLTHAEDKNTPGFNLNFRKSRIKAEFWNPNLLFSLILLSSSFSPSLSVFSSFIACLFLTFPLVIIYTIYVQKHWTMTIIITKD